MELTVGQRLNHWWFFLLRGISLIGFGIYIFTSPAISFVALGFVFGLTVFIAGVSELISARRDSTQFGRGLHLAFGLIDLILGSVLMAYNTASMNILRIISALWVLYYGYCLMSPAPYNAGSWRPKAASIPILVFGALLLYNSTFGNLTIIYGAGTALVVNGLYNAIVGIRMKQRWFIRSQKSPQGIMETFS